MVSATVTRIGMSGTECQRLQSALLENAESGQPIIMGSDTSFVGTVESVDEDAKVITAVSAVPVHY